MLYDTIAVAAALSLSDEHRRYILTNMPRDLLEICGAFEYIRTHREWRGDIFERVLQACGTQGPPVIRIPAEMKEGRRALMSKRVDWVLLFL